MTPEQPAQQSFKPSRRFIIRGSIAIGIVAIILIVQTAWFRALFHKKPLTPVNQTVGDIITQDTNGNGIPDWEEKLWGLDPTVLYTKGVPNKQIIEERKKALGMTDIAEEDLNDTDRLARQLYALTTALGQNESVDDQTLQDIATKLGSSVNIEELSNTYSTKDIRTVQTTRQSLLSYYAAMGKIISKYDTNTADINVIITALETGDTSRLPELAKSGSLYMQYSKEISTLPVPVGVASYHLAIMNSFAGIATSFVYLGELDDNGVSALTGIAIYRTYNSRLSGALIGMREYLTRYGIL